MAARKTPWNPDGIIEADGDPHSLKTLAVKFIEELKTTHYSEATVVTRAHDIQAFIGWCGERGIARAAEVTRPILKRYQRHLFYYRKPDGEPLTIGTQKHRMVSLCRWFRWLTRSDYLLSNPAAELELPRDGWHLPAPALTLPEVEAVMAQPDIKNPLGLRDRAIMEALFSTGVRRLELANLRSSDVDRGRGLVLVRQGKGRRDRVVPIGERALAWIDRYLAEVRPRLVVEPDDGRLFLSAKGTGISHSALGEIAKKCIEAANVGKKGSCHMLRHTAATLMLANGADVRLIQEFLGHRDLSTTALYTKVNVMQLKEIHSATHPGARLPQKPGAAEASGKEDPGEPE